MGDLYRKLVEDSLKNIQSKPDKPRSPASELRSFLLSIAILFLIVLSCYWIFTGRLHTDASHTPPEDASQGVRGMDP